MRTLVGGMKCKVCDPHHLRTHGMTRTSPEFQVWSSARDRCNNPNHPAYGNYGARGIRVCERWQDFSAFYEDMGPRLAGTSLDRIDNSRGYEPGNCRWATKVEQANNRRTNRRLTINGVEKTLAEWCGVYGVRADRAGRRIKAGWPIEQAVSDKTDRRKDRRQKPVSAQGQGEQA